MISDNIKKLIPKFYKAFFLALFFKQNKARRTNQYFMIQEDVEISLASTPFSDNNVNVNKETQHQPKSITKSKRGRPPKSKKKCPSSKTQSTEERKSDWSPEVIMIGSSKAKLAKANTIIKKIKKRFTSSKFQKKVAPVGIPKVAKQSKTKEDKTPQKITAVLQNFKTFLKELKGTMQKTMDEGEKILKEFDL